MAAYSWWSVRSSLSDMATAQGRRLAKIRLNPSFALTTSVGTEERAGLFSLN